jgi:polyisoprenoid-binding protein YceI
MKSLKQLCLAATAAACMCAVPLTTNYSLSNDYAVTIHGTSNLHNWDEKVGTVSGDGSINLNSDGSYDVDAMTIKMDVHSIKSDMGSIMNNNTYKALKADANPQIILALSMPLRSVKVSAGEKTVPVKANLTIAGVTRPVSMQVKVAMPERGKLLFEGAYILTMSDYGIKPPTALLGTLKTGNDITINFKTGFTLKANQ